MEVEVAPQALGQLGGVGGGQAVHRGVELRKGGEGEAPPGSGRGKGDIAWGDRGREGERQCRGGLGCRGKRRGRERQRERVSAVPSHPVLAWSPVTQHVEALQLRGEEGREAFRLPALH